MYLLDTLCRLNIVRCYKIIDHYLHIHIDSGWDRVIVLKISILILLPKTKRTSNLDNATPNFRQFYLNHYLIIANSEFFIQNRASVMRAW